MFMNVLDFTVHACHLFCNNPDLHSHDCFIIELFTATVALEHFDVKKDCVVHTSTKLEHVRFFCYEDLTFE